MVHLFASRSLRSTFWASVHRSFALHSSVGSNAVVLCLQFFPQKRSSYQYLLDSIPENGAICGPFVVQAPAFNLDRCYLSRRVFKSHRIEGQLPVARCEQGRSRFSFFLPRFRGRFAMSDRITILDGHQWQTVYLLFAILRCSATRLESRC